MNPRSMQFFKCPDCHNPDLELDKAQVENDRIMGGRIRCTGCRSIWPIIDGVPRFVSSDNYARSFGAEWKLFSKTQLDSHTGTTISRDRFIAVTQVQPSELTGKTVLDCGCGMGRFLEVLAQNPDTQLIGVDFSAAVDAAFANLRQYPNVTIVQADLFRMPLKFAAFDMVYSIGVLHHTPNTRSALQAIARHVKHGGLLSVWIYRKHIVPKPHYLYHYVMRRLPPEKALAFIKLYHPIPWALRRIPYIGRLLASVLPISDYRGILPLNPEQQVEWSYLDTMDKLTPWYIWRHTPAELLQWAKELAYTDIQLGSTPCSIRMRRPVMQARKSA